MSKNLIVIEGLDGCGKQTQSKLLVNHLKKLNYKVKYITFPNYDDDSSSLIKMYLNSEFGKSPNDVNAYAASSFYAVDRYASFKKNWCKYYNDDYIIICDRYTTSNAIYQMSKLEKNLWENYIQWLYDYEYNKLELPKPDKIIYLDVKVEVSQKLMYKRYQGDENKKDLHESNINFLKKCYSAGKYISNKDNWCVINCCNEKNEIKSIDDINNEIILNFFR